MKKKWLLIPLLLIIVAIIWYVSSTQWTRDLSLRYFGYLSPSETYARNSGHCYEMTNNTRHTLKDVIVVIEVEYYNGSFKYEDWFAHSIPPGQAVAYKLRDDDYKKAAEKQGISLIYGGNPEIVKIKYSK